MTASTYGRDRQNVLTANLLAKASADDIPVVEIALGRFKGADAVAAASLAADAARRADRWDNLAYLADFLHDMSTHGGRGDENDEDDGRNVSAASDGMLGRIQEYARKSIILDCVEIAGTDVLSYVTLRKGAPETSKEGGGDGVAATTTADIPNLSDFVQNRVPVRTEVATFVVVDEDASAGEYRSAENPSPYVSIADPKEDIGLMRGADDRVVDEPAIHILYSYPFDTTGPTLEEKKAGGWIFEEKAPNGRFFTRADLARVVAARYNAIYDEEAKSTTVEPGYIPGMLNRNRTNGRYGIWGYDIGDLVLRTVEHDPITDVYMLGIDS